MFWTFIGIQSLKALLMLIQLLTLLRRPAVTSWLTRSSLVYSLTAYAIISLALTELAMSNLFLSLND
jgi:hypothetical protein